MTKEKIKELLPIIEAYINGKQIQSKTSETEWQTCMDPKWFDCCEYRIKPDKKLVPFTFEDRKLFIGQIIQSKTCQRIELISSATLNHVNGTTYRSLLENWTFLDNSPCGKYIEE